MEYRKCNKYVQLFTNEEKKDLFKDDFEDNIDDVPFYNEIEDEPFFQCSEIIKKDVHKLENSVIFYLNKYLKYSEDNYAILKEMFYNCDSLNNIFDLSKIDTS